MLRLLARSGSRAEANFFAGRGTGIRCQRIRDQGSGIRLQLAAERLAIIFYAAGYSEAYLAFFQTVVHLRTLSITEETLRDLWHLEKKLWVLLHADSTGSSTWLLDSCGATTSPKRRLLLTSYELGAEVHGKGVCRRVRACAAGLGDDS